MTICYSTVTICYSTVTICYSTVTICYSTVTVCYSTVTICYITLAICYLQHSDHLLQHSDHLLQQWPSVTAQWPSVIYSTVSSVNWERIIIYLTQIKAFKIAKGISHEHNTRVYPRFHFHSMKVFSRCYYIIIKQLWLLTFMNYVCFNKEINTMQYFNVFLLKRSCNFLACCAHFR